jgi:hypothetical protein
MLIYTLFNTYIVQLVGALRTIPMEMTVEYQSSLTQGIPRYLRWSWPS